MTKIRFVLSAALWLFALSLFASDFYVAPAGSADGNGTRERPWDLATALAQPSAIRPGDTIWLRGGTYVGHFTSRLKGSADKPIVVRQYMGERAIIDGNDGTNAVTFLVNGSDTWFWALEITNSDPTRSTTATGNATPVRRGEGVHLLGPRTRMINAAIHDTAQGILSTAVAVDAEIYGNLIYYNGWDNPSRGSGHGVYVQNDTGQKQVADNLIFDQFGWGIHAYTESGKLDNLDFEGNVSFNNGAMSQVSGYTTNILLGASGSAASNPNDSAKVAKNATLRSNFTYFSSPGGTAANLGYSKGIASPTIVDNYFVGGTALALVNAFRPLTMRGNSLYGSVSGFQSSEFPNNTYYSARPTGVKVFVRPNKYEPGRANITVYNWDKTPTVDVDVRGSIMPGRPYELRNAQNFFGPPVLTGVYDGAPLRVPMTGLAPATPIGRPAPAPTGPEFQVFVLLPTGPPTDSRGRVDAPSVAPRTPRRAQRSESGAAQDRAAEIAVIGLDGRLAGRVTAPLTSPNGDLGERGPCARLASARLDVPRAASVPPTRRPSPQPTPVRYFPEVATSSRNPACHTSIFIANSGIEPATVALTFLEHDRNNVSAPAASFVIGAGQTLQVDDALSTLFGMHETYGAMELEVDPVSHVSAVMPTVSEAAPTSDAGASPGGVAVFANELESVSTLSGFRDGVGAAEITLLNPNAGGAVVSLTVSGSPARPSETTFVIVPPRGYVRRALDTLFPMAAASGELLSVAVDAGALPLLAFASVETSQPEGPGLATR